MPDWLRDAAMMETPLSAATMGARLGIAAALGLIVAVVYRLSHGRLARDSRTLVGTLVLLTVLLAMVTMVIGDSVARAFGLVGALSIVRFRTVVDDTRDTAFVIFAVVVGMAVGTGLVLVAVIGIPVVAVAAIALSALAPATAGSNDRAGGGATLAVRLGAGHPPHAIDKALAGRSRAWKLAGIATTRHGAAMDLTYSIDPGDAAAAQSLVAELNALPGVQSVDLRTESTPD